jgi:hypothetical protein
MSNPYPTPEAIARLNTFGEKALSTFIDEVSPGSIRNLVPYLPFVHGFRRTSQVGIQQQKRALARRLATATKDGSGNAHQREYEALYVIWRAWGLERLGDAETIEEYLSKIEDFEDQRWPARGKPQADNEDIETLFLRLRDLSRQNKCSREHIDRFFAFSPFTRTDAISRAIAESKSATDVDHDAAFTGIPERVQQTEQEIQSFKAQIRSIIDRIDAIPDTSEAVAVLGSRVEKLVEGAETLGRTVASFEERLKTAQDTDQAIKKSLGVQAQDLAALTAQVAESARQQEQGGVTTSDAVARLAADIQSLALSLEALAGKIPNDEWRAAIEAKVETAGAAVSSQASPPAPVSLRDRAPKVTSSRLRFEPLFSSGTAAPRPLNTAKEIASIIASNLQSIGLKNTAAQTFSEEITGAVIAGQIVFFKGAFSTDVARLCAVSLSGGNAYRASIPLGLDDGEELRQSALETPVETEDCVSSIVLEGVNRSALELFEDVLIEMSSGFKVSLYRDKRRTFIFGSLLAGAAALPVEASYLQLGPIFDLDYLDWRGRPSDEAAPILGKITNKAVEAISRPTSKGAPEEDVICGLIARGQSKRHPQLERAVLSGYRALCALERTTPHPSALQSLAYGWLAPLWLIRGLSREAIDEELDGGKFDCGDTDPRLSAILKAAQGDKGDRS